MELDGGDSAGESTNASWVNTEDLGRRPRVFESLRKAVSVFLLLCFVQRLAVLTDSRLLIPRNESYSRLGLPER